MTKKQHKVMTALMHCRSSWFGYHEDACGECGHVETAFNSCRDRHCPKCQGISRRKWIQDRLDDVLPVPYYHLVFTLPREISRFLPYNKKLIYNLLFSAASETLLTFGRDPRWLGGEMGFYGVLHTWGQTLWPHPHLHFLVPGGALATNNRWISASYRGKFLFPVRALSQVFKGKFVSALKEARSKGALTWGPDGSKDFEPWLNGFASRPWVVYCKSPLRNAEQVIGYIGRYTHRVAISNHRIEAVEDGQVVFGYKDYKTSRTTRKTMRLAAQEFIRRFLFHVLPSGFHKIRHFGFLANGRRKIWIPLIQRLLKADSSGNEKMAVDAYRLSCPACKRGTLFTRAIVTRFRQTIYPMALLLRGGRYGCVYDTA